MADVNAGKVLSTNKVTAYYEISFDGNGADEGAMENQTFQFGMPQKIKKNMFTKAGYIFAGWNTKKDGSGKLFADEASINNLATKIDEIVPLYAQWTTVKYAITYQLDGGTNSVLNPNYYDEFTETITLVPPTKTGYRFDGWYSNATFTEPATAIQKGSKGDKTFYAKWTANRYTIKFDGNGSTEGSMADLTDRVYGQKYVLPENTFQKTGYIFGGWNSVDKGTGKAYADKAEVESLAAENGAVVTLYAQWTTTKYTITYYLDGGTNSASNPERYDEFTATITLVDPSKTGFLFDGWYSDAAFETRVTEIPKGSKGDIALYAKWKKPGRYTVIYNLGGGTNNASNPERYDENFDTITLAEPSRTGYTFKGWYSDAAYKTKADKIETGSRGNKIFYAKWAAHKYTIKFDANGGTGTMSAMKDRSYGTRYELTANRFKRADYSFAGWSLSEDGSRGHYRNKESVADLTDADGGVVTLYAQWKAGEYSVTYHLYGGDNHPENPDNFTKDTAEITLKDPTRTGYQFAGWYISSGFKKQDKRDAIPANSSKDVAMYAKWTANKYTVTFNGNGATDGTVKNMTARSYGKKFTLSANKFTRKGYSFNGWNTLADGSGTYYKNRASVQNLTAEAGGSAMLYAQWKPVKYTITYKLNGGAYAEGESNPKSYNVESDAIVLAEPVKKGYTFAGWYSKPSCKEADRVTGIGQGSTGNRTLYAKWDANKYTVNFDGNGATDGEMDPTAERAYGKKFNLRPNKFTRTGYKFKGWTLAQDGSGKVYKNKASVKNLTDEAGGSVTLYAQWKAK